MTNFCASFDVCRSGLVTLLVQARLASGAPRNRVRPDAATVLANKRFAGSPLENRCPLAVRGTGAPLVSAAAFTQAVTLLRLLLHDLKSTVQAYVCKQEVASALRELQHLRLSQARRRSDLGRLLPGVWAPSDRHVSGNHSQQIVQAMVDYAHQHYHHPMGLKNVATDLKMNASYLSNLFSRTLGVHFHDYLEAFRLARAAELLCDPRRSVREVAFAVGYNSAAWFRHAFKCQKGLSPSAWRELPLEARR